MLTVMQKDLTYSPAKPRLIQQHNSLTAHPMLLIPVYLCVYDVPFRVLY